MAFGGMGDLMALSKMLHKEDGDDDAPVTGAAAYSPADMVASVPGGAAALARVEAKQAAAAKAAAGAKAPKDPKAIWDEYVDKIPGEDDIVDDPFDTRKRPRYDILYKQSVGSEDVFLGLGDKSPATEDCEAMVVKVHFPGCKLGDLELNVTERKFSAESRELRLSMFLPLPVHHKSGKAKWDARKEVLAVTLLLNRDL